MADSADFHIKAARDGGLAVYEAVTGETEATLVHSGNLDEFVAYMKKRGETLLAEVAHPLKAVHPLTPPHYGTGSGAGVGHGMPASIVRGPREPRPADAFLDAMEREARAEHG